METIQTRIKAVLDDLGVDQRMATPDAHLVRDWGLDSLDVSDLMMRLEKQFQLTIPDSEWSRLDTYGAVLCYLTRRMEARGESV